MPRRVAMRAAAPATASLPSQAELDEYVSLAQELASCAATVTTRYFRTPVGVDTKSDASPVTVADREAEEAMREVLTSRVPEHAIYGEEYGHKPGSGRGADWTWVLDPIDGTKSFITGRPLFGTLIALAYRGRPVLGVLDQPVLRERWLGVAGRRTTKNGREISTRPCARVGDAYLFATTPHMFRGAFARPGLLGGVVRV